jgi:arabinose-5-phosphate isomerase
MLKVIQEILEAEAEAIRGIPADNPYQECAALFIETARGGGKVVVSGVGKAGEIGRKIAATFCSVGVPSVFLHPLEAQHGDLGMLHANDVMLLISNSGKTRKILELASLSRRMHLFFRLVTLTGNRDSLLVMMSNLVLWNGNPKEVCPLGLTPTTSTTTMAVIGDILAVLIVRLSDYKADQYALRHHSGYLGEKAKSTL